MIYMYGRENFIEIFPFFTYTIEKRRGRRMDQKRIPIGYEDFKKFKEENLYLVEKTLMIK